jgi:DnaJ-class molecular chaperone
MTGFMSWRRRQSGYEQEVIKNCRSCEGSGYLPGDLCSGYLRGDRCPSCRGSGKAKTVYRKQEKGGDPG